MSNSDFVRELRLRKWARIHFVAAEFRKTTWHPIVLEEMDRRDQEILSEASAMASDQDLQRVSTNPTFIVSR